MHISLFIFIYHPFQIINVYSHCHTKRKIKQLYDNNTIKLPLVFSYTFYEPSFDFSTRFMSHLSYILHVLLIFNYGIKGSLDTFTITASSAEELVQKIQDYELSLRMGSVQRDAEKLVDSI